MIIERDVVVHDGKDLFKKLVTSGNQRRFLILSFRCQALIKLFTGNIGFDSVQGTHVQNIAKRFATLPAYLTSAADAGIETKLSGAETCVTDELPIPAYVFKPLGIENELCLCLLTATTFCTLSTSCGCS